MEAALTASRDRLLELLGLGSDATLDAVKLRYRELARRHHPDVNPGDDRAHSRFRAILAAYQQLLSYRAPDPARAEPRPDSSQEIPATCSLVVPLPREERIRVVLIEIRVKPDRDYRRRGDDLLVQLALNVDEAFAGTRRQLVTPSGPVTIVVPRHSRRGDVIRIPGRGVPGPRGRGDLFVELSS